MISRDGYRRNEEKTEVICTVKMTGADTAFVDMFPEGTMDLAHADPELYGIIKDEKKRQKCVEGRRANEQR